MSSHDNQIPRGLPPGAWKHLRMIQIQIDEGQTLPGLKHDCAILCSFGKYSQFSFVAKEHGRRTAYQSLVRMPVDPNAFKLVLDLVDLKKKFVVARCKVDLRSICTSTRSRKKFQTSVPMATTTGETIDLFIGVRLSQEHCKESTVKTFASRPTRVPSIKPAEVKRHHTFKEGRMKVIRVPREGGVSGSPKSASHMKRNQSAKPITKDTQGGSFQMDKPRIVTTSDSGELHVVQNPMQDAFYQDLAQKDGFGFIGKEH